MIIFGLTQFGNDDMRFFFFQFNPRSTQFAIDDGWPYLPCVTGYQQVMSLSRRQSDVWIDYVGGIFTQLL